jgi:hypothetical protein
MARKAVIGLITAATAIALIGGDARPGTAADANLNQMVAGAKTSADHAALAAEYEKLAKDAQAKAEEHRAMAAAYRRAGGPSAKAQLPEHCDGLVKVFEGAAKDYTAMAAAHRELAKGSK